VYVSDTDEQARKEAKVHFELFRNRLLKMPIEMLLPPGYTSRDSLKNLMKAKASLSQELTIDKAIDRDPKSGWAVFGDKVSAETVSAYVTLESPTTAEDSFLILHLDHRSTYADHNIGRLRLHVSRTAPADTNSNTLGARRSDLVR
jgi:hypothetical protein